MPMLEQILSDEKQVKSIVDIAAVYGFENVRVFKETSLKGVLILLVSAIANQKSHAVSLATSLEKALGCQVNILTEQDLKPSCKNVVINGSVSISNFTHLQTLFNKPLNEIVLKSAIQDNSFLGKKRAQLANDLLNAKNQKLSDFFTLPSQPPENNKEVKSPAKREELIEFFTNPANRDLADKIFRALPSETIEQMDRTRQILTPQAQLNLQPFPQI